MQLHAFLLAAEGPSDAAERLGALVAPGILALVFLALALLAVVLLLILVLTERRRLAFTRQQLQVQILTHLQTSFPGVETDLEFLPSEPVDYKAMTPDAKEAAKAYLDFCAERFYWWRNGLVDGAIWNAWERGMSQHLKRPGIQVAWKERHARELVYEQAFKDWVNRRL